MEKMKSFEKKYRFMDVLEERSIVKNIRDYLLEESFSSSKSREMKFKKIFNNEKKLYETYYLSINQKTPPSLRDFKIYFDSQGVENLEKSLERLFDNYPGVESIRIIKKRNGREWKIFIK